LFAGDRVPLPAATVGSGAIGQNVVFDNLGVSISLTPFIVDCGRVRLQASGRVRSNDPNAAATDTGGSMRQALGHRSPPRSLLIASS